MGFRGGCGGRTIEGRDKPRRLGMGRGRQRPSPSLPPNPSGASLQAHTSDTQAGAGDMHTGGGGGRGGGEKQSRPNVIPGRQSLAQSNALRAYASPSANPCSKRRCQTRRAGAPGLHAPELQPEGLREGLGCRSAEWLTAPVDVRVQQLRRGYLGGGRSRCCLVRPG